MRDDLRGFLTGQFGRIRRKSRTWLELKASVDSMIIDIQNRMKEVVSNAATESFHHGYKLGKTEGAVAKALTAQDYIDPDLSPLATDEDGNKVLDEKAQEILRVLHGGIPFTNSYGEIARDLSAKLNAVLAQAFIEQPSLDKIRSTVLREMRGIINVEVWKLTRIARTELINVTNEGRLAAYQKREEEQGEQFRYTLIVARGERTCDAHRELGRKIPKRGMLLDDLKDLQQVVGAKYGLRLQGAALLHPNQRTVLMRAV